MKESFIEERLQICKECPIYSSIRGICNSALWLNPKTEEVSETPKNGYIRGCGCNIFFKTKSRSSHCIAGKW